jgi:hypothetical protein
LRFTCPFEAAEQVPRLRDEILEGGTLSFGLWLGMAGRWGGQCREASNVERETIRGTSVRMLKTGL